jgi:hypothetical protein
LAQLSDEELRVLVREAIARHLGPDAAASWSVGAPRPAHASHALFQLPVGGDAGGACLIEPAVRCIHCGYCQSYGH